MTNIESAKAVEPWRTKRNGKVTHTQFVRNILKSQPNIAREHVVESIQKEYPKVTQARAGFVYRAVTRELGIPTQFLKAMRSGNGTSTSNGSGNGSSSMVRKAGRPSNASKGITKTQWEKPVQEGWRPESWAKRSIHETVKQAILDNAVSIDYVQGLLDAKVALKR